LNILLPMTQGVALGWNVAGPLALDAPPPDALRPDARRFHFRSRALDHALHQGLKF